MKVRDQIKEIISDLLGIEKEEIKDESRLYYDLEADSLDEIEIIMEIEKKFGIMFTPEDEAKISKVEDLYTLSESKI